MRSLSLSMRSMGGPLGSHSRPPVSLSGGGLAPMELGGGPPPRYIGQSFAMCPTSPQTLQVLLSLDDGQSLAKWPTPPHLWHVFPCIRGCVMGGGPEGCGGLVAISPSSSSLIDDW
jgi:hypothetical protein